MEGMLHTLVLVGNQLATRPATYTVYLLVIRSELRSLLRTLVVWVRRVISSTLVGTPYQGESDARIRVTGVLGDLPDWDPYALGVPPVPQYGLLPCCGYHGWWSQVYGGLCIYRVRPVPTYLRIYLGPVDQETPWQD